MGDFKLASAAMPNVARAVEISLSGDVTSTNVVRFQEEVTRLMKPHICILVFLMKDAGFISSAGFAYLSVDLAESLERRGGMVIMVDPPSKIRVIMETLGIERLFTIVPELPSARKTSQEHVEQLQKAPRLVEVLGTQEGMEYPLLASKIEIGSDQKSTIVLKHHQVERHHAEVYKAGEQCFVKDLGSRFGTYVGKKKVAESPLAPGDIITIATFRYAFVAPGQRASGLFPATGPIMPPA